ncbi:MAG: hypothetical protein OHK0013_41150 [Sandaracinaceae bacterium]
MWDVLRPRSCPRGLTFALAVALACGGAGCAVVPRYARGTLGDPAMQETEGMLARTVRKLRNSREGAAGGDGAAAGGGCGCGQ